MKIALWSAFGVGTAAIAVAAMYSIKKSRDEQALNKAGPPSYAISYGKKPGKVLVNTFDYSLDDHTSALAGCTAMDGVIDQSANNNMCKCPFGGANSTYSFYPVSSDCSKKICGSDKSVLAPLGYMRAIDCKQAGGVGGDGVPPDTYVRCKFNSCKVSDASDAKMLSYLAPRAMNCREGEQRYEMVLPGVAPEDCDALGGERVAFQMPGIPGFTSSCLMKLCKPKSIC